MAATAPLRTVGEKKSRPSENEARTCQSNPALASAAMDKPRIQALLSSRIETGHGSLSLPSKRLFSSKNLLLAQYT